MKHEMKIAFAALLLSTAFPAVQAKDATPKAAMPSVTAVQSPSTGYWTAERFKAAKPLPMPQVAPGAIVPQKEDVQMPPVEESGVDGVPPQKGLRMPREQRLYMPDPAFEGENGVLEPQARGTFRSPYTSTRVFPLFTGAAAIYSADRTYPYRTVGKLFFSINGSPFLCSASVIRLRVIATAGHCVHSGNGAQSGFYSDFVFVPAFRNGTAPYLSWDASLVAVTLPWYNGGGGVPNAADHAMIVLRDRPLTPGGSPVKIGNVVGTLGWQLNALSGNHTSKLGYPCNLDSCQIMQNVMSTSFRAVAPNNVEYGSDAEGGSSGGPWVQNFEVLAAGGGTGTNTGRNRVVGVSSYIYVPNDPKVQGASNLGSDWNALISAVCADAGNCS